MNTTPVSFSELGLKPEILQALEEIPYETATPIQTQSIPHLLDGKDLLGQAQTGTGKTAAFALPLLNRVDVSQKEVQVLTLMPTRELAIQVAEAFKTFARHIKGLNVITLYGGQNITIQLRELRRGAHVIIGTPGRIQDHLKRRSLSLRQLKSLVLDEADEMLKMGFQQDVEWILEHVPNDLQTALFSATMPHEIRKVARKYLHDPVMIEIKSKSATASKIDQYYWKVAGINKLDAITRILEYETFDGVIIFMSMKHATVKLAENLEARGYSTCAINGDMNQPQREKAIEQLKNKKYDIIVATDVAARGLDVDRITHVFNYDIPYDTETYVNRIGRTGRAGREGKAIMFVSPREIRILDQIERTTRTEIKIMPLPTMESIIEKRITQFKQQVIDVIQNKDVSPYKSIIADMELEFDKDKTEIASAIAYLLNKSNPLKSIARIEKKVQKKSEPKSASQEVPTSDGKWARYRIEVGREHGATPKGIVTELVNNMGYVPNKIGKIQLFSDYTYLNLDKNLEDIALEKISKLEIDGTSFSITLTDLLVLPDKPPREKSHSSKNSRGKPRKQPWAKPRSKSRKPRWTM